MPCHSCDSNIDVIKVQIEPQEKGSSKEREEMIKGGSRGKKRGTKLGIKRHPWPLKGPLFVFKSLSEVTAEEPRHPSEGHCAPQFI